MFKISSPIVSVNWLKQNFDTPNLVIIDATMKKITWEKNEFDNQHIQIQNARYLDIKSMFSDTSSEFPNTMLSAEKFQEQAKLLGINNESTIVVYDDIGIYTSPRVWWMFKSMGFENIAVLNGGLPEWIKSDFPTEETTMFNGKSGDFTANFDKRFFNNFSEVLKAINSDAVILDARSEDRFDGTKEEPREGLRSGHIPNSKNLHYQNLLNDNLMKSPKELVAVFDVKMRKDNKIIFSCGSGITACILALGADIVGCQNLSVYDGSWTEWGSLLELPIE